MDTQDLITAGGISDIENGYLLLSDLGLRALFSVYCAKGKDFDQFIFKNEMKELGFNNFFAHKVFSQLEVWRNSLPEDITEDEVKGSWNTNRRLPDSVVYIVTTKVSYYIIIYYACANIVHICSLFWVEIIE